jgi:peptide chain release factor 2
MEKYEINKWIEKYNKKISDFEHVLKPNSMMKKIDEIRIQMQDPNFWNHSINATKLTKELSLLEKKIKRFNEVKNLFHEIREILVDDNLYSEMNEILSPELEKFVLKVNEFDIDVLLSGPNDYRNAILEIHPGAGGTESQDWAEMLLRMYQRFFEKNNYKVDIIDFQNGDEAGIKSVTLKISGEYVYGNLKSENGVHRLVRISPFDSNQRRHTSFASVEVTPEFDEEVKIEVKDEDLKIDVYRSSGAGGQSVNTTDSAVRITHLKSGTVVTCQNERSQLKNKETALKLLKAKLYKLEMKKKDEELNKIKGIKMANAWGSQIRSYVFHPYQMIKDHRTNLEVSSTQDVMDGNLENFINAYLKYEK